MGRYYCDYCDVFLTHDSFNCRRAHMKGRKHKTAVRDYYAQFYTGQLPVDATRVGSFQPQQRPPTFTGAPASFAPMQPPAATRPRIMEQPFDANGRLNPVLLQQFRQFQEQQRLAKKNSEAPPHGKMPPPPQQPMSAVGATTTNTASFSNAGELRPPGTQ